MPGTASASGIFRSCTPATLEATQVAEQSLEEPLPFLKLVPQAWSGRGVQETLLRQSEDPVA